MGRKNRSRSVAAGRKARRRRHARSSPRISNMVITDCPGCALCDALAASGVPVWNVWDDGPQQAESPRRDGPGLSFDQTPDSAEVIYGDKRTPGA